MYGSRNIDAMAMWITTTTGTRVRHSGESAD